MIARSPLPWLHIAEVVAHAARARGFRRIGITGTRYLTESEVYPQKLTAAGLEHLRPCSRNGPRSTASSSRNWC